MAGIGPKKAINILPSKKISITPGKTGNLLPEGSRFTVYGKKKPKLTPSRFAGRARKGALGAVNRYLDRGGRRVISRVYSAGYRTVPSGAHTFAVRIAGERMYIDGRLNEAAIGWLSESGQLTTARDFRDTLISIDATTVGSENGQNVLTNMWDSLSTPEKARIVDEFADFDWADFWTDMYPVKGVADVDNQYERYDNIVMRIERALGRSIQ